MTEGSLLGFQQVHPRAVLSLDRKTLFALPPEMVRNFSERNSWSHCTFSCFFVLFVFSLDLSPFLLQIWSSLQDSSDCVQRRKVRSHGWMNQVTVCAQSEDNRVLPSRPFVRMQSRVHFSCHALRDRFCRPQQLSTPHENRCRVDGQHSALLLEIVRRELNS